MDPKCLEMGTWGERGICKGDIAPLSGAVIPEPPALPTRGLEMGEFCPCSHPHLGWELGRLGVRAERPRAEAGTGSGPGPPGPPRSSKPHGWSLKGLGTKSWRCQPLLMKRAQFHRVIKAFHLTNTEIP